MSEGVTNERGIEFSSKCFLTASLITPSSSPREDRKRGPRTEWREGGGPVLPNSRDKVQGTERSKLASKKRGEGRGEGWGGGGKKEGGNGAAGKRICRLLARFSSLFGQQERLVVLIPVLVRCSGNPHAGKTTTRVSASPSSLSLSLTQSREQRMARGGEERREHTDELSVPFLPLSPCR